MAINSNKTKSDQLGMAWGTANHRLTKLVLFALLKRHGENTCFRCGLEINSVEELSKEHKVSWLSKDTSFFWDTENVVFAHVVCNSRAGQLTQSKGRRKIGPEGTSWCSTHRAFLPIADFYISRKRWNGLTSNCKSCDAK